MKEIAEELSQTYGSVLLEAIETAYQDWREAQSDTTHHKKRTRASYVWDCALAHLRESLSTSTDFYFHDVGQTTYIIYRDRLRLQFKGFNTRRRISSVPTRQVSCFTSQLPLGFETTSHLTNIYLAYELDPYETGIQSLVLACPAGASFKWIVPLEHSGVASMDLFDTNVSIESQRSRDRLKLKIRKDVGAVDGAV